MKVIYWSGTGNTEVMAKLIIEGIEAEGQKGELINISSKDIDSLKDEKVVVLGCPSMGQEQLEESEFEPFMKSIEEDLKGKKVVLFGSYGWGDGEWMRNWQDAMISIGADMPLDPIIVNDEPEGQDIELCKELGRNIAQLLK